MICCHCEPWAHCLSGILSTTGAQKPKGETCTGGRREAGRLCRRRSDRIKGQMMERTGKMCDRINIRTTEDLEPPRQKSAQWKNEQRM